jgi:SAM-dependent methyltransferase
MVSTIGYAQRFQAQADVGYYDLVEYRAGAYASCIWDLQRPVLLEMLRRQQTAVGRPLSLLDFACGTGRVLAFLENFVATAEGIDISPEMVAVGRQKCSRSRLRVADILAKPAALAAQYDVITAFRFLLNVEPEVRRRVLRRLREALRAPDGLLLVNMHGNSRSLRHPAILWRRWRERARPSGAMLNEMSPGETRTLLRECGFEVVRQVGFGLLPPTLYRTPAHGLARVVDQCLAGQPGFNEWSIDLLLACRPI